MIQVYKYVSIQVYRDVESSVLSNAMVLVNRAGISCTEGGNEERGGAFAHVKTQRYSHLRSGPAEKKPEISTGVFNDSLIQTKAHLSPDRQGGRFSRPPFTALSDVNDRSSFAEATEDNPSFKIRLET